ncbi:hypothetical protein T07_2845 [Trichinella nelsoni]|uniref:Uncharacterized protein n=1 Tax=Trichinella nelsoni TaxID=6336 RepID=A0A0V0SBA0_9BILA|nr:hypothetical protein T07_2845 [Trichinella nelsoni]
MKINRVKPQALPSGYAQGQIKICICPKATPQAIYSTIFDLRRVLCKFLIASAHLIRNHVDKYVITKHYYQLIPLSLATSGFRDSVKGSMAKYKSGYALGYASGKILKISNFLKYSPRLYPQAMPEGK